MKQTLPLPERIAIGILLILACAAVAASQPRIVVELPDVARLFGVGNKGFVTFTNPTPYYAEIITFKERITVPPGGSGRGVVALPLDHPSLEIPAVVLFFEDRAKTRFVASASRRLNAAVGQADNWVISPYELIYPNGAPPPYFMYGSPYPAADYSETGVVAFEVSLPMPIMSRTSLLLVNTTHFDAVVVINNDDKAVLKPGDVYRGSWYIANNYHSLVLEVLFLDRGRIIGRYLPETLAASQGAMANYPIVLSPYSITR